MRFWIIVIFRKDHHNGFCVRIYKTDKNDRKQIKMMSYANEMFEQRSWVDMFSFHHHTSMWSLAICLSVRTPFSVAEVTKMFTRREFLTLALFCAVYISWGLTDSIQAPFYPREASEKGATSSEYGFVFGIIHLAIFIW